MSDYFSYPNPTTRRAVPAQHTTPDGPDMLRVMRLIGIELTYVHPNGTREEIQMLIPHGGKYDLPHDTYAYGCNGHIQVTLHTSHGDRQANVNL